MLCQEHEVSRETIEKIHGFWLIPRIRHFARFMSRLAPNVESTDSVSRETLEKIRLFLNKALLGNESWKSWVSSQK